MRIAVIGGGFTGLTAAYKLSQKGHKVTLFEKEKNVGGLAKGLTAKNWHFGLENFFHHLFTSDAEAKNLIAEVGLSAKLFFIKPKTSIFLKGGVHQFDSPLSILTFPYFSTLEKIRIAAITTYLKFENNWQKFEKQTATSWLTHFYGGKVYSLLWKPLLEAKFDNESQKISMTWFWARIKKRSAKLGYLEGGFQVLTNKLVEKIKESGGEIYLNHKVDNLDTLKKFDRILFTTPTSEFLKISDKLSIDYQKKLKGLKMIGALNLILTLEEKFLTDNTYWLNINEPGFPFVAVVEHTNFVDKKHYGNQHLLYVGGYYPQNHPYFKMGKEQILKKFLPFLKKINPQFNRPKIINYHLSKSSHAQPVVSTDYFKNIPSHQTPIKNVYLANMQQIYPWDRGINYAIKLGEKIANEIQNS